MRGSLTGAIPCLERSEEGVMTEVISKPPGTGAETRGRISHWIGGQLVAGKSGRTGPVYNPAVGRQTAEVDFASVEEVGAAVAAAKEAFSTWREWSLSRR